MDKRKVALSKSILEMKFMQRTKNKVEKQKFEQEGEEYFSSQLKLHVKKTSGKFIMEPSYVFCENLNEGRLSFQGMNPLIEKLMEERQNERTKKVEQEDDVSDEQMAIQWQKMRAKFNTAQRHRSQHRNTEDEPVQKKPKFLKPVD